MSNSQLNLRKRNLRVIDISSYNFIGAHLEGADLRRKNLTGKNLTGAKLINANLERAKLIKADLSNTDSTNANFKDANLTEAKLQDAFLFKADLTRATLIKANLKGAYLSTAILTKANLEGANLEGANLTRAILIGANLEGANLEGANLTGANLIGAILSGVILSEIQKKQIISEPEYIVINQGNLAGRPRNLAIPVPRRYPSGSLFIQIPKEFLKLENSPNDLCPNYNNLYDFILDELDKDISRGIQFKYIGQPAIDAGGVKRDIFEKLLPIYTHRFFESIENNNECVILKNNIDMEIFGEETGKMIFLAYTAETKIFLKIDPSLLSLLSSDNYKEYFSNNKKDSFTKLYDFVNLFIKTKKNSFNVLENNSFNVLENNMGFLRNKPENNIIRRYKTTNNAELKDKLRREIRLRRILVDFGFKNWKQFENMHDFYKNIIEKNKQYFSFKLDFNLESFLSRFKICKGNGPICFDDIPLSSFGKLSDDKTIFIFTETNKNINDIYEKYEYLRPFLDYILGPKSTDKRRAMCIVYVTGSSYYPGSFTFVLQSESDRRPFDAHTCMFTCYFFKKHRNGFEFEDKEKFIEDTIKHKSGSDFSSA